MNIKLPSALLLAVALPLLGACQPSPTPAPPSATTNDAATSAQTAIGRSVEKAIVKAREEMRTKNISIGDGVHFNVGGHGRKHDANLPKAEITPQGDLQIEGKAVAVDAAQRKLLLQYRDNVIAVADAGMSIGVKGADLAGRAISETIGGLISGDTKAVERKIEAEAARIEADAMQLCAQLPPMLATQEQLAASLPAFKPYATMTQEDIDDCGKEGVEGASTRAQVRHEVRARIRETVRNSVRDTVRGTAQAAAGTDAASANTDTSGTAR